MDGTNTRGSLVKRVLLLAMSIFALAPFAAHAALITYRADVVLQWCEGSCIEHYEADTGLTLWEPAPVSIVFTIDTNAPGLDTTKAIFSGPGTGLSVTVGDLTLFYSTFDLSVSVGNWTTLSTGLHGVTVPFFQRPDGVPPTVNTVNEFLSSDLSAWGAGGISPLVEGPFDRWQLFTSGDTLTIRRVDEPGTLPLLALSVAAFVVALRRKRERISAV